MKKYLKIMDNKKQSCNHRDYSNKNRSRVIKCCLDSRIDIDKFNLDTKHTNNRKTNQLRNSANNSINAMNLKLSYG